MFEKNKTKQTQKTPLGRYGVLEPNVDLFETCKINLTPGIIDTQAPEKNIYVLNCGDQNVTIYPDKGNIGLVFPLERCHILKYCVQKFITKQNFHLGCTICFEILPLASLI
jgi:hypothetical protein